MESNYKLPNTKLGWTIFLFLVIIVVCVIVASIGRAKIFAKEWIGKKYKVDKRTITHWIQSLAIGFENIKGRKKFSFLEVIQIMKYVGNPLTFPVLEKKDLNYFTGCKKQQFNDHLKNFKEEPLFRGAKKFPPFLGVKILRHNGVTKEEIEKYFKKNQKSLPFFFKY